MSFTNVNSNFSTFADLSVSQDTNAEAGAGGTDLDQYTAPDEDQLRQLWNGNYSNQSSYTPPHGIVDTKTGTFSTGLQNDNNELSPAAPESDAEAGAGGEVLDLYYQPRTTLLKRFAGDVTNKSSFPTPKGIVDSPNDTFGTGLQNDNGEEQLGHFVTGKAIAPNGLPLEGTVQIEADGDPYHSAVVTASFIVTAPPLDGVTSGENGDDRPTFDVRFVPKADAVSSINEDVGYPDAGTLSASYGIVYGWVTDESGEAVAGATVAGDGAFTTTNPEGYYQLLAPGGRSVNLQSVDGTATDSVSVVAGQEGTRKDWQFAGVEVRVLGPDYNPIENAPVTVAGETYRTDENGQVVLSSYPLGTYNLKVMETYEEEIDLTAQGALSKTTVQGGRRLRIRCYASDSGDEIADLPAIDVEAGTISYTNATGLVQLLTFDADGFDVLVAENDQRYISEAVEATPADGETAEAEVVLDPQPAVSNR